MSPMPEYNARLQLLPPFLDLYRCVTLVPMLASRLRWVHAVCESLYTEDEVEQASDEGFACTSCTPYVPKPISKTTAFRKPHDAFCLQAKTSFPPSPLIPNSFRLIMALLSEFTKRP